jgi:thiol-disulfide isomerase/thioredoxin
MNLIKYLVLTAIFFISAFGFCQNTTTIIGKIKKGKGKLVYLMHEEKGKVIAIDSAKVNFFGKYKLSVEVVLPSFYQVTIDKKEGILLILKGDESLKIKSTTNFNDKRYSVSGSDDSKLIQEYLEVKSNKNITKDSLKIYASQFVDSNASSLAVFVALNDAKDLKKALISAEKGIGKSYPNSFFHNTLKNAIKSIQPAQSGSGKVQVGQVAPELNMVNPEGKIITIESLKGKIVLIDFWASWCGPCRRENPNVVKLYNQYKNQGFEIYSVSLDKDKAKWINAIKKDNLSWPYHVSDLKGWSSAATAIYGFRGIPYTVLLDREGRIIQTRLRGADLEIKLAEIFAK